MSDRYDVGGDQQAEVKPVSVKRRGLIAGAAALVATALASKAMSEEVSAANGSAVLIGGDAGGSGTFQLGSATTWIATPSGSPITSAVFRATNGFGGTPDPKGDGIQGITVNGGNAGSFGRNNDLNGVGTWGEAPSGTGAFGDSVSGSGVAGSSTSGAGVYGQSTSGFGASGISSTGIGVFGQSTSSYGVEGLSNGSYGVVGVTTAANFGGCTGITETTGAAAFLGGTHNASAYAGFFAGTTVVQGNFAVSGIKSAAVPHKDGTHRLVYCVEAPDSWFEDVGEAKLVNGQAKVTLDPEFMAIVHSDTYHVFMTEYEGHNDLYVSKRTSTGFEVHAKSGSGNGSFSWRLMAKRADVKGERLAKFTMPKMNLPTAADVKARTAPTSLPTPRPKY